MLADRLVGQRVRGAGWSGAGLVTQVLLLLAGSAFLAASARISIPLPFTPVPITAQTLAVLLVGALYGSRLGPLTLLAYLGEGLIGLPVFHNGTAGPAALLGPTGGYLLGFVLAAFIAGWLLEGERRATVFPTVAAFLLGDVALTAIGAVWLAHFVGYGSAWTAGVLPFIPGEVIKIGLATASVTSGRRLFQAGERDGGVNERGSK